MNKLSDEELIGRITLLSDTNQGTIHSKEFESAYDGFFDKQTRF